MADDPRSQHVRRFRQRWLSTPPPRDAVDVFAGLLQILGDVAIKKARQPRPLHLDLLTFDEVVRYFVEERPDEPRVDHGVLLARQGLSLGIPCLQLFVDRDTRLCLAPDDAPYGRFMVVRRLDGELRDMLDRSDLVVFN